MAGTIWHCHVAMSLDGKIARPDGSFDWLEPYPPQEFGIDAFIASIDAIVMGRATYEVERRMSDWRWSRHGRAIFWPLPASSKAAAAGRPALRVAGSSFAA